MSINVIGSSTPSNVFSTSAVNGATTRATGSVASASEEPAAVVRISKGAELFGELSELQKSDPAKLKARLTEIAADMKAKASQTGDARLGELASKFEKAAESEDISSLESPKGGKAGGPPPGGKPPAGGPPPGGGAGRGVKEEASSSSDETDPADTNGDGTVSAQEALNYAMSSGANEA